MSNTESIVTGLNKFKGFKPKAVRVSEGRLVRTGYLEDGETLPLLIQPEVEGLKLAVWAAGQREMIGRELMKHGAILFRGFNVASVAEFEEFARAISPELLEYGERSSPRSRIGGGVYTSTDHPAEQHILLHNEQSYTLNWPMKIWFYCAQPAAQKGRTPIADSRNIFKRLSPQTVQKFQEKQVLYIRNYGEGLGLSWQDVFRTTERAEVEQYCRQAQIEFEWRDEHHLRTRQVRPAIRNHPWTGEPVWFNHAVFFNVYSLDAPTRESMLGVVGEEDLPFNTFYGDGTPIEPSVLEELWQAYSEETKSFSWQQGDVLMLDNMLTAHGREPFVGERKIAVAMAEPFAAIVNNN